VAPKCEFQQLDECLRVGRKPGGEHVEQDEYAGRASPATLMKNTMMSP
jgi:hypothetical protein